MSAQLLNIVHLKSANKSFHIRCLARLFSLYYCTLLPVINVSIIIIIVIQQFIPCRNMTEVTTRVPRCCFLVDKGTYIT